ncbi:MAG TPA: hypothetical protein VE422_32360 [Terriglobia bacterium]|nr:hypothetical protein [Terriglobia bacterium]
MLLLLKLCLVPILVATVTIAAGRWGPVIGGWLTALPIIAGPTLCFYAIEQGTEFAARATQATLVGLVAVVAHSVTYAHMCRRWSWPASLIVSWIAFAAVTALLYVIPFNLLISLLLALASFAVAQRALPPRKPVVSAARHPGRDLLLRMLAAAGLVLILTSLADRLGPTLSGFLTPFPIATAIIAAFTQAERGPDAVISYFHGFVPALSSFALFCFVFALALVRIGLPLAVTLALSVQLLIQGVNLWRMMRSSAKVSLNSKI